MLADLQHFFNILEELTKTDESFNPAYLLRLGQTWHALEEDCRAKVIAEQKSSEILSQTKSLLSEVSSYPKGTDHKLGHYLTKDVGEEWIPFPYMEMLRELHREHNASPTTSTLNHWMTLISDILSLRGKSSTSSE